MGTRKRTGVIASATAEHATSLVSDRSVQVGAVSATVGAVGGATAGGATGLLGGATAGGLVGLPLAFVTLGASIPVCAMLGGGLGMSAGAATGGAVGAAATGAAAYNGHKYRNDITAG